jgi:hypothetical protein
MKSHRTASCELENEVTAKSHTLRTTYSRACSRCWLSPRQAGRRSRSERQGAYVIRRLSRASQLHEWVMHIQPDPGCTSALQPPGRHDFRISGWANVREFS